MAADLRIKGLVTRHVGPIDLELISGECITLTGPSGAGKSLMLRAIADLDQHNGEIWLQDTLCTSMRAHQWRRRVGMLAAESQWWAESVGEHFWRVDEALLEMLGFPPAVMQWQVANCSTGERQRLALLRLLQNEPQVLLLDEPTASLDAQNVERVEQLLKQLQHERSISFLWVSHDSEQTQRVADRRFRLVDGKIEEMM